MDTGLPATEIQITSSLQSNSCAPGMIWMLNTCWLMHELGTAGSDWKWNYKAGIWLKEYDCHTHYNSHWERFSWLYWRLCESNEITPSVMDLDTLNIFLLVFIYGEHINASVYQYDDVSGALGDIMNSFPRVGLLRAIMDPGVSVSWAKSTSAQTLSLPLSLSLLSQHPYALGCRW